VPASSSLTATRGRSLEAPVAQTAPTDQPSPEARAPQTAEIIKTFGQRCPQVVINNLQTKADFIVLLDHEGGKGALRHENKVVVFNRVSGDSIVSKSTLSLGESVQDACEGITSDWAAHGKVIRAAAAPSPAVQPAPTALRFLLRRLPLPPHTKRKYRCSRRPMPPTSKSGSFVGNTPSTIGVSAGQHQISVKKSGFKPWERKIQISSGQINVNTI
jgi:hypothetical protein